MRMRSRPRAPGGAALPALLLLIAGCAAPRFDPPELAPDVPTHWSAEEQTAPSLTQSPAAPEIELRAGWWNDFDDAALDTLVALALANNHDLRGAATRIDAAAAQARMAGAALLPSAELDFDAARRKQNFIGLPIPGSGGGVISSTSTNLGVALGAAWEIDLWGRIRSGTSAAKADLEATEALLQAARLSLTGQLARAWFAAVESHQQLQLARSTAASYTRTADWVRERYERGLRPSLDLRLALSNKATAEAGLTLRRLQFDAARRQVEILLGHYPRARLSVADSLRGVPPATPAGLPAELLTRRPDLAAAERRIAAADARVAEAWRAQFPRLSLTASGGTSSTELADLIDSDFSIWSLMGRLVQPVFQGGRLRAGVHLARARLEESMIAYESALLGAFLEVENALAAESYLAQRETELTRAVEQARGARELAEQRYFAGLVDYVTVLESQRAQFAAESQWLGVRRQRLDARVNLHLALGGGFTNPRTNTEAEEAG